MDDESFEQFLMDVALSTGQLDIASTPGAASASTPGAATLAPLDAVAQLLHAQLDQLAAGLPAIPMPQHAQAPAPPVMPHNFEANLLERFATLPPPPLPPAQPAPQQQQPQFATGQRPYSYTCPQPMRHPQPVNTQQLQQHELMQQLLLLQIEHQESQKSLQQAQMTQQLHALQQQQQQQAYMRMRGVSEGHVPARRPAPLFEHPPVDPEFGHVLAQDDALDDFPVPQPSTQPRQASGGYDSHTCFPASLHDHSSHHHHYQVFTCDSYFIISFLQG
jgi:hypothetical protein